MLLWVLNVYIIYSDSQFPWTYLPVKTTKIVIARISIYSINFEDRDMFTVSLLNVKCSRTFGSDWLVPLPTSDLAL